MAKIGAFDPGVGLVPLRDGSAEIGRGNLPEARKVLPASATVEKGAPIFGRLGDSALMERFAPYLALDVRHRELLSPDVFFEALTAAAESFADEAGQQGEKGEGPLVDAARYLAEVLADRALCEMLSNLVIKA